MTECPKCGRSDGHWLNCSRIPKPAPPEEEDSVCDQEGCDEPRKGIKYCAEHGTTSARNARAYRNSLKKEKADE